MTSLRQIARDGAALWRFSLVDGIPDAGRVRGIAGQLIASDRRSSLRVLTHFLRRLRRDGASRTAEIHSAVPLDAAARAAIEAGLTRRYGHAVAATFAVDPALIAGIRLTVGGTRFDGSVRARLSALEMPS